MKFSTVAIAAIASVAGAQIIDENGQFLCPGSAANGSFCAGESLTTNIIIRCTDGIGHPGNCNDNLDGVPPVGVKDFAPCWQSSDTAGDAGCSFNGIVYPDSGQPFPIPGYSSSITSSTTPITPSIPIYSTTSIPIYSTTSIPIYSTTSIPIYSTTSTSTTIYSTTSIPIYSTTSNPIYTNTSTTTTYVSTKIISTTSISVSSSTIKTITGATTTTTHTIASTGTTIPIPSSNKTTIITTSLPTPSRIPSGAGALLAKDGLVLGAVALIGFLFL